ncbi:TPA: hypothetical protein O4I89_002866 [Vibrio cholerae]|uniref:hypothetical protein n=1 Tax=Vibrio cholerae TaxID=666 RepID=UPI0021CF24A0|nr:hypothetical protein [Vibrio cholerae]MCU4190733.1 hypothetical protein [Vibrio cholerae]HCZ9564416.1 hypothetical protein [Vibrio cholerae]HCZ9569266.1 hypothetical protein [Vibrio cholerae]HCZ9579379.1 hypothetical protein [Vibrio cholerae]HCZ9584343.1 hypothetical protein [Vibrio cholerae]
MEIEFDKLKAIICLATDKMATILIQEIAGNEIPISKFSYSYDVLVDREHIALVIQYNSQNVLNTTYFYTLTGSPSGAIKISLSDTKGKEVLSLDFNENYDFSHAISHYNLHN